MILALAVILGLFASLIRHRTQIASQLANISLNSAWLAILALALQYPLLRAPFGPTQLVNVQQALFLLSHLLLLTFVWQNRQLTAMWVVGLGLFCNLLVILANGGFMPISPETLTRINPGTTLDQWPAHFHYGYSKDVILSRQDTNLWALSDILMLSPPFPWPTAFSLGDLMIGVGIVLLLRGPRASLKPTGTNVCSS
jgi:hypothetical protein